MTRSMVLVTAAGAFAGPGVRAQQLAMGGVAKRGKTRTPPVRNVR
jgi:hypothetical protein